MQSVLPDLNTAIIKFRASVSSHLRERDYTGCFGSLYAMNGILDEEYRVKISTEEYDRLARQDITIKCQSCTETNDFLKIKVYNIIMPSLNQILSGNKYEKIWVCPKCKKDNVLSSSAMQQTKLMPGGFLGVLPEPPERQGGVTDRTDYHNKVAQWVWTFVKEIEQKCGEERKAYLNRGEMIDNAPEDDDK